MSILITSVFVGEIYFLILFFFLITSTKNCITETILCLYSVCRAIELILRILATHRAYSLKRLIVHLTNPTQKPIVSFNICVDIKPAYRETKSHAFIGTVLCIDDIKCFYVIDCAAATSRNVSVSWRFTAACVQTVAPHHFGHHTNQPG